jgi:hypothetical protein
LTLFSGGLSVDGPSEAGLKIKIHRRIRTILGFSFPYKPPSDQDKRRIACPKEYVNKIIPTYFIFIFSCTIVAFPKTEGGQEGEWD